MIKKGTKDENEFIVWLFSATLHTFGRLYDSCPFLSKKPNNNGPVEECAALMTMAAVQLALGIKVNLDKNDYYISAIILRSLIEVAANITYITRESDKRIRLCEKYLETVHLARKNLYAINNNDKPTYIEWADLRISRRVSLLGHEASLLYRFLSSYTHSDAGFMGSYYYKYTSKLKDVYSSFGTYLLFSIWEHLIELNLVKNEDVLPYYFDLIRKKIKKQI